MSRKVTFFVFSTNGSRIEQINIRKSVIFLLGICLISFSMLLIAGIYLCNSEMLSLKIRERECESRLSEQQREIAVRYRQIHNFLNEIKLLKTNHMALEQFEKQIRFIAELAPSAEKGISPDQDTLTRDGIGSETLAKKDKDRLIHDINDQIKQLKHSSDFQEKNFRFILKHMHEQRDIVARTPSFHPTKGLVIARFGYRKSPFTGQKEFHRGLDIANQKGTSVVATANGTVAYAQDMGVFGNVMAIDHGYGLLTRYAHLDKFLKKKGDPVKKGEVIAELGDTGLTTGPHLHYEVHVNGTPADPVKYILDMNECFLARNTF